jgi:hypothetical protein
MALSHFRSNHFASAHYAARHFRTGGGIVVPRRRGGVRFRAFYKPDRKERLLDDDDVILLAIKRFIDELII